MSPRQFYTDRDGCLRRAEDDALTLPLTYSRRQLLVKTGALGLGALSAGSLVQALLPTSAEAASNLGLTLRQAAAGGTLVFAVDSTAGVADPATFTSFGDWMVVDTVCRGLMLIDFKTTKTFGNPDLASGWTVSDSGLLYQFKIRSGRKFHDGTRVTAKDCERSFNHQLLNGDPTLPVGGTMALRGATGRNISGVRTSQIHVTTLAPCNGATTLSKNKTTRVYNARKPVSTFVMMNMTKTSLKGLRVRQAINYAIDRDAIMKSAFFGQAELPKGYN